MLFSGPSLMTSLFLLSPEGVGSSSDASTVRLDVRDNASDYGVEEGLGVWVSRYNEFLLALYNGEVHEEDRLDDDAFDHVERITIDNFNNFEVYDIRVLLIAFTNRWYSEWVRDHLQIPSMHVVEQHVLSHECRNCRIPGKWQETYDETNKPIDPAQYQGYEQEKDGMSVQQRDAVKLRNQRLRFAMQAAWDQWIATRKVVGRVNVCADRCDNFYDWTEARMRSQVRRDTGWLQERWDEYCGQNIDIPALSRLPEGRLLALPLLQVEPQRFDPLIPLDVLQARARRLRRGW